MWKLANVAPIFKKVNNQLIKIPACGKILEKIIFSNLYIYLPPKDLITNINRVFVQAIPQLTNYYIFLMKSIRLLMALNLVRTVFPDISRAFDKVWHDGLIFKLGQNGITGNLLRFFQNYLSNRKQRVVLNGSYSDYSSIESGVVHISCLHQ